MPYLTSQNLSRLLSDEKRIKAGILRVDDFEDVSDRTLTLGYNGYVNKPGFRNYDHIYLEGGQLRRHLYTVEAGEIHTKAQTAWEGIHVEFLQPSLGTSPSATDLEFAQLMAKFHKFLIFFALGSEDDKALSEKRVDGEFFGWRQKYYFENGNSTLH